MAGLLNVLRGTLIPGQETILAKNVEAINELMPTVLGKVWIDVLEIAQEVKTSTSTEFNIALTVRIMAVLAAHADKKTQDEKQRYVPIDEPDGRESGEPEADSEPGDTAGEGQADPDGSQEPTDEADSEPGDTAGEGQADPDGSQEPTDEADSEPGDTAGEGQADPDGSQEPTDEADSEPGDTAGEGQADPDGSQEPTDEADSEPGDTAGEGQADPDGSQEPTDEADSEPGDTAGEGQADPDGSQEPTDEADSEPGDTAGEGHDGQTTPSSCKGELGESFELPDDHIMSARQIIDDMHEETIDTELGDIISKVMEIIASSIGAAELSESTAHTDISDEAKVIASKVKRISDDLQEVLETQTKCAKRTKLSGKRLNNRVLNRVPVGNGRVFSSKTEAPGVSTAVSILFDISGSMKDSLIDGVSRDDAAMGLALGLGDVLDEYDVPFDVSAYSDRFVALKGFDDEWSEFRKADKGPSTFGGTHTGAAMQRVLEGLVCRTEDRRLVIAVTDGDTSDTEILFSTYAEAQAMGIEIASVMIGPRIPAIEALANRFGFTAKHFNKSEGLGRFAVERILEAI
ncbi:von Willebrand factor type A domain protein [Rhodoferax antarcticus ANT.BR]|uniref:von Willebrand factor type A domain protein n=2 Tax=Rhodoferax antarcticus TaxID=81479 RepID=A0A1Q8Y9D2_9BURK|nr:von Willebrand factor type A domain protein [Rhodoferax antarcticus ANT.BR]